MVQIVYKFLIVIICFIFFHNSYAVLIIGGGNCASKAIGDAQRKLILNEKDSLTGLENLNPESDLFKYAKNRIVDSIKEPTDLPQINSKQFSKIENLNGAGGKGNSGILTAELNGKKVVIKKAPRELVKESKWFMILNKMGLGPEFHGITILEDGTPAIVTEFIDGAPFSYNSDVANLASVPLSSKMEQQIRETGDKLFKAGIRYAPDMQFMLAKDGRAVLIDPEFFEFSPPLIKKIEAEGDPRYNAKITADRLKDIQIKKQNKPSSGGLIFIP